MSVMNPLIIGGASCMGPKWYQWIRKIDPKNRIYIGSRTIRLTGLYNHFMLWNQFDTPRRSE